MFFGIDPEEYDRRVEEARLHGEAHRHDLFEWLETLDAQGLKMFKSVIAAHSDQASAAYLMGVVAAMQHQKFNICIGCGNDHSDISVEDIVGKVQHPSSREHADDPVAVMEEMTPSPTPEERLAAMSGPELIAAVPEAIQTKMDEYGVDFIEYQWPKVICRECGDVFVSLDDRMLRDPGVKGCSNCQEKAKWG